MDSTTENNDLSEAEFQRLAQTIATSIQKIVQNVSTMQRMINHFNTPQDSPDLKKQLLQIMTYTRQLVSDTDNLLKDIAKIKARHLKIQRDRLVDEFTSALTAFQAVQRKTVDIEKNAIQQLARTNNYNIPKPPSSNNNSQASKSFFEDNFGDKKGPTQTQIQEEIDLQALEEQERVIRELERNIVSVNEIYKNLGAMVYEQGMTVDSIEVSVEQTSAFVHSGTENLRKASQYKNKLRKRKVIIAVVVLAILIILITIIAWKYN